MAYWLKEILASWGERALSAAELGTDVNEAMKSTYKILANGSRKGNPDQERAKEDG